MNNTDQLAKVTISIDRLEEQLRGLKSQRAQLISLVEKENLANELAGRLKDQTPTAAESSD